jgi:hypothetical protein
MSTGGAEVIRVIDRIESEGLELEDLKRRRASAAELEAKERSLECLRWRLAAIARLAAHRDLGSAA